MNIYYNSNNFYKAGFGQPPNNGPVATYWSVASSMQPMRPHWAMQPHWGSPSWQQASTTTLKPSALQKPLTFLNIDAVEAAMDQNWVRKMPWRLLAYAEEAFEPWREFFKAAKNPWLRSADWFAYGIASAYTVLDAVLSAKKTRAMLDPRLSRAQKNKIVAIKTGDSVVYQLLANVAGPGLAIAGVKWLTHQGLKQLTQNPTVLKWGTPIAGFLAIPAVVKPLDHASAWLMEKAIRPHQERWIRQIEEAKS